MTFDQWPVRLSPAAGRSALRAVLGPEGWERRRTVGQ